MNEKEAYIALNMFERLGPVRVRAIELQLGSVMAVFDGTEADLVSCSGIGKKLASWIVTRRGDLEWEREISRCAEQGIELITPLDSSYPESLRKIYDPPLALYVKGDLESRDCSGIAVVGTRRPSNYGRETAERLSFALARAGRTVLSGLALGIDTCAHNAALKAGGRTLAVIGSGFGHIYPDENTGLADEIVRNGGSVISELPLDRQPDKTTFPMRNRIVSGISEGVLVIEAGRKSGAVITANQALEQGRNVYAVPGRIDNPVSAGCHELLKDGARLVTGVDDIIEEHFEMKDLMSEVVQQSGPILSGEEKVLVGLITEGNSDVDALIRASGISAARVSAFLLSLEMKRVIRMLPGRTVELLKGAVV